MPRHNSFSSSLSTSEPRTGLIIQGPIFSPGYGPYEFDNEGFYKRNWIEYESSLNIMRTLEMSCPLFDFVVLATWKNPVSENFLASLNIFPNLSILELQENDFLLLKSMQGIHKYHQIFTSREGARRLIELGAGLIAKCRTDQTLNMQLLYAEVLRHGSKNANSIGVPNINLFELDRLTDFYFVGNATTIESVFSNYLEDPELFEDTHKDYFYKFSKSLSRLSGNRMKEIPFFSMNENFKIASAWTEIFYPLDSNLFKFYFWRGRRVNHRLNSWIRWFYVFHGKSDLGIVVKTFFNYFLFTFIRFVKKPMIHLLSRVSYRWYRWLALNRKPEIG